MTSVVAPNASRSNCVGRYSEASSSIIVLKIEIQGTAPLKKDRDLDLHDDTQLDLESRLASPKSASISAHQVGIEWNLDVQLFSSLCCLPSQFTLYMRIYVNKYLHSKKSTFAVCFCLVINKIKLPLISKLNPALIRGGRRLDAASGRTTTIPFTIVLVRSTGVNRELTPIGYGPRVTHQAAENSVKEK